MTQLKGFFAKIVSYVAIVAMVFNQIGYAMNLERDIYTKADDAIRIMSFNVLYGGDGEHGIQNRFGIVTRTVTEYYPDSLGLQEATPLWMLWFNVFLPEYDYVGVGRDDGRFKGEYAAIFYLKDKYRVVESETFWLSQTPDKPSRGWDAACNRVCTWAVLENKVSGKRYAHINTHLDHVGSEARKNGVNMILEKAASFNLPVVCTGDFNFRETNDLYTTLTSGVLHDTKFLAPDTMSNGTFHDFSEPADPKRIIDYILTNTQMTPLVYRVITEGIDGRAVSDHYPIYSDMMLNASQVR